jgi:hypothetical protein
MDRRKIGLILFWLGVISVIVWQALTWIQSPIQRVHTAEELRGSIHAVWGALFWIRIIGGSGLTFAIVGVLLYTSKEGSYFWLLGFLPNLVMTGQYWQPSQYVPQLFGVGGTVILLSYFGILWLWTQTYAAFEGDAKTGRQIQLLGISTLVVAALLLCLYFGNQNQIALAELAIPSPEIINLTLGFGMSLLFVGHYVVARGIQESNTGPKEALRPQPSATD